MSHFIFLEATLICLRGERKLDRRASAPTIIFACGASTGWYCQWRKFETLKAAVAYGTGNKMQLSATRQQLRTKSAKTQLVNSAVLLDLTPCTVQRNDPSKCYLQVNPNKFVCDFFFQPRCKNEEPEESRLSRI